MKKAKLIFTILVITMTTFHFSACAPFGDNSQSQDQNSPEQSTDQNQLIEYKKGTITNKSFESEYLNLKVTLPENFIIETEAIDKNSEGENTSTELQTSSTDGISLILYTEKLENPDTTIEQYLDGIKNKYSSTVLIFDDNLEAFTIAGQDYTKLTAHATAGNELELIIEHIIRKQNDRMVVFGLSYEKKQKDTAYSILQSFTTYK